MGYCCDDQHRLLVYEYVTRGSLEDHLLNGKAQAAYMKF